MGRRRDWPLVGRTTGTTDWARGYIDFSCPADMDGRPVLAFKLANAKGRAEISTIVVETQTDGSQEEKP